MPRSYKATYFRRKDTLLLLAKSQGKCVNNGNKWFLILYSLVNVFFNETMGLNALQLISSLLRTLSLFSASSLRNAIFLGNKINLTLTIVKTEMAGRLIVSHCT